MAFFLPYIFEHFFSMYVIDGSNEKEVFDHSIDRGGAFHTHGSRLLDFVP